MYKDMMEISAIILTRGERNLSQLKKSLEFCKEVIIIKKPHIIDFAEVRNSALSKAKYEWVLYIDDDETVTSALRREIIQSINNSVKSINGYNIRRKIFFLGKQTGEDKVLRLAKRDAGKWRRAIHEVWNINGQIGFLKNYLIHNTAGNLYEYIAKINWYSDIHAGENLKEGKRSDLFKIIIYPMLKFIENILLGRGFIFGSMQALHSFLSWVKLWNLQKKLSWESIFIFLFLVVFPFGQIIRIGILHPLDIVVGLAAVYSIFKKFPKPEIFRYFDNFILFAAFSWLVSVFIFRNAEVLYGILYLFRLAAYFYFLIYIWHFARKNKNNKTLLTGSLLSVSVVSAIFGWIQYFLFPSMRAFFEYGWDEHLFRLVGTFLDPTFLGIIIVFGLLTIIYRYMIVGEKKYLIVGMFMVASLIFTYSRASYLAFFAGLLIILTHYKKIKYFFGIVGLFLFVILLLPTSKNRVLSFTRSFSTIARIENYSDTLKIFRISPVYGIGFNNMCLARRNFIGPEPFSSHSCSGSDSSLLLILATTGIVGLMAFVTLVIKVWSYTSPILRSSLIAIFVHSLFSNSLFYPWVLGYLMILLAVALRTEV